MWDELVNYFDLTVTKEDIKKYNEMKKKGAVKMTVQEALARLQRIVGEYENLTDKINKSCYYEEMPIREIKIMLSELNELHMMIARKNEYIKLLKECNMEYKNHKKNLNKNDLEENKMNDDFEKKVKEFLNYLEQEILKDRKKHSIDTNKLVDVNKSHWFIDSCGAINNSVFDTNDEDGEMRHEIGNCYQTKEDAKKAMKKIKIYTQLKDLALRLNKGEMIRWNDLKQSKYSITRDVETNELVGTSIYCYQDIGQIYCLDSNFLNIAKREIGEKNLRKLFK